jgi:DNA-binding FadR family transcriptional regulator
MASHAILAEAGGNRVVTTIMRAILDLLQEGRQRQPPEAPSLTRQAVAGHRQIADAVAAADGRLVEALMLAHRMRVHERAEDAAAGNIGDAEEVGD